MDKVSKFDLSKKAPKKTNDKTPSFDVSKKSLGGGDRYAKGFTLGRDA